jgi:hypothetical protein
MKRLLLAACALLAGSAALACGEALGTDVRRIEQPPFVLAYRPAPTPIPVGRHFSIDFVLCAREGAALPAEVRVDALMPEHKHGMNYRPSVSEVAAGIYRAEGLMFHMPGRWELVFELRGSGAPRRLSQSLQIG